MQGLGALADGDGGSSVKQDKAFPDTTSIRMEGPELWDRDVVQVANDGLIADCGHHLREDPLSPHRSAAEERRGRIESRRGCTPYRSCLVSSTAYELSGLIPSTILAKRCTQRCWLLSAPFTDSSRNQDCIASWTRF